MPIDYTKRPKQPEPPAPPVPPAPSGPSAPVVLTKAAPSVSLAKTYGGMLRVNLNWNARPTEPRGFFRKADPSLDLDLACVQLRVHGVRAAAIDGADDADHHLGAELLGLLHERLVVADDDLRDAVAVADVDEQDGAHVADAVDPSEQDGRLADRGGPQRAAGVGTTKVSEWLHCV